MDSGGAQEGEFLFEGFRTNRRGAGQSLGTVRYVREQYHIPGTWDNTEFYQI